MRHDAGVAVDVDLPDSPGRATGHDRRRYLLARARAEGRIEVAGAAHALEVSVETIRRDLKVLEDHGLIRR